METIRVGISQYFVVKKPDRLETQALGSCVAVILYEPMTGVGGMAHAMLPDQDSAKESSRSQLAKFANTATEELLHLMIKTGAKKSAIQAKLVGGANMFPDIAKQGSLHIGKRNVESAKAKLVELGIPLVVEETGGTQGRSVLFDSSTGEVKVKSIRFGAKVI